MRWRALILTAIFGALLFSAPVVLAAPEDGREPSASAVERSGSVAYRRGGPEGDGEPYQWKHMAFGGAVILTMTGFVVWLVRRQR